MYDNYLFGEDDFCIEQSEIINAIKPEIYSDKSLS